MKYSILKTIVIIAVIFVWFLVSLNILLTEPVSKKNTIVFSGHFQAIKENRPSRGSLNYDLYIEENPHPFKIGADWADCFYYGDFIEHVKVNQLIKIFVRKNNGFLMNPDIPFVVSIVDGDRSYLEFDCVNENLRNEKIYVPPLSFLAVILGFLIYKYRQNKGVKKIGKRNL